MKPNDHFNQGVSEALREAQKRANTEKRSIKVGNVWVNPSVSALAKRTKITERLPEVFTDFPKRTAPRND
jgi:hypothetical protein